MVIKTLTNDLGESLKKTENGFRPSAIGPRLSAECLQPMAVNRFQFPVESKLPMENNDMQEHISRRELLQSIGLGAWAAGTMSFTWPTFGIAQDAKPAAALPTLNRFSRVVQEWFVDQVRQIESKILAEQAALKSKADAEVYVRNVQQKIRRCFGPDPERTPLNARVTKVVEREQYRIENVIFESRPGVLVTANLYVPKNRKGPFPGVVGSCGHSANGKAGDAYQPFAQTLAKLGYVCLIFDPIDFRYSECKRRSY